MARTVEVSYPSPARPLDVWTVLGDLESWADWLHTVTSSRRIAAATSGRAGTDTAVDETGAQFRLEQPRLAPAVWTVTEWRPGRSFTWTSRRPGLSSVAEHEVAPEGTGSRIVLRMTWSGPLARLVERRYGALTREYMLAEAEALSSRSLAR